MKINNNLLVIGRKGASSLTPENILKSFQKTIEFYLNCLSIFIKLTYISD